VQVTLKVLRWEERDKRLVIKDAELVAWNMVIAPALLDSAFWKTWKHWIVLRFEINHLMSIS
jgi:hypothetical protein